MRVLVGELKPGDIILVGGSLETVSHIFRSLTADKVYFYVVQFASGAERNWGDWLMVERAS